MLLRARAITSGLSCNLPYGVVLATNGILRAAISTYLEGQAKIKPQAKGQNILTYTPYFTPVLLR